MNLLQIGFIRMNLFQMSVTGGVIILIVAMIRALLLNRLPKRVFLLLWMAALVRLTVPYSVTSAFSIYTLLPDKYAETTDAWNSGEKEQNIYNSDFVNISSGGQPQKTETDFTVAEETDASNKGNIVGEGKAGQVWNIIWLAGMLLWGGYFTLAYIRCRRGFQVSFPVEEKTVSEWLGTHSIRRPISIRRSGCICAPLSYGIIHPVILMPENTDWDDRKKLFFVLEHEFVHIRRFDAMTKLFLTGLLCVHWFNPMVWLLYVLFNRDLELSCDERVVRHFGEGARGDYARTLISMEEKKSGLLPLCNSFSKNAIEQRIKSVMKIKKTSVFAIAVAGVLIAAVFICFATSAGIRESKKYLQDALDDFYSEKEGEMLAAVWLDDYESMTVPEYQEKIWKMTDTAEYMHLLEDFSKTTWAIESSEKKDEALWEFMEYFSGVLEPLTGEKWKLRQFSGFAVSGFPEPEGNALLEYVITLKILQPKELTTAQYRDARLKAEEDLHTFIQKRTKEELADEQLMTELIDREIGQIVSNVNSENLEVSVEYVYQSPAGFAADQEAKAQVDETLEPYREFGLTWEMEPEQPYGFFKMYWQGREVRGIIDEKNGVWITAHSGNSTYADDAIDLYTVYEGDSLSGLRQADQEEQDTWTAIRESNEVKEFDRMEERRYPLATEDDFKSVLKLMEPDYRNMSVADFEDILLDWCNEDYERMERVGESAAWGEYPLTLTEEQKSFVELTYGISREENYRLINNTYADRPLQEKDIRYGHIGRSYDRETEDGLCWYNSYYCFYWYISDRDKLTVGARDDCIRGFMDQAELYFSGMDLDELLTLSKEEVTVQLQKIAKESSAGSDGLLTIEINDVRCEGRDERGVMDRSEF